MAEKPIFAEPEERLKKLEKELHACIQSNKALNQSEKQYRNILSSIEEGYYEVDLAGNLTFFNDSLCNIYGYARDELMGLNSREYMSPESFKKSYEIFDRVYKTGEATKIFDWEFIKRSGAKIDVEISVSLIKNPEGEAIGFRGFVRDISERKRLEVKLQEAHNELERRVEERTKDLIKINKRLKLEIDDRKQAEVALQKSEEKSRLLFESMSEGFALHEIITDELGRPCDFRFLEMNAAYERLTGLSRKEVIGRRVSEIIVESPRIEHYGKVALTGESERFLEYSTALERWFEVFAYQPIPGQCAAFITDITDRKRTEEEQAKLQAQLSNAMEIARLGHWEYDVIHDIFTFNDHFYKMFRTTAEDVGGYTMSSAEYAGRFVHPDDISVVGEEVRKAIEAVDANFSRELEHRIIYGDGTVGHIIVKIFIVKDDQGKTTKTYGVNQDMTERRRMEKELLAAQKMESIGNLAGGIAHDFNNILSSIIGFTELALDDTEKGTPLEDNLQEVYTAGKRARDLVKQILAFARQADAGEQKPIKIDVIIKETLGLVRSTIPTTIEIRQTIESHSLILGNETQIHQILMNLLTNAAQAMEDTGGILEVSLTDVELKNKLLPTRGDLKPGSYLKLTVSDTGPGIAPDIIGSIFEPYFTTKGVGEGTGMGLAVTHGIVKRYGGEITVESELGKGAVFSVLLPVTKKRDVYRTYEEVRLPTGIERILLVDDELPIVKMGSQILEGLGYLVTVRTSSVEALELFRSKPNAFELVITDMTMPNMTGDELAIELMKIRPDIPVILCTGYSKKITDEVASKFGIKAFAYKPIVKAELAKTVRKVLDEAKGATHDINT